LYREDYFGAIISNTNFKPSRVNHILLKAFFVLQKGGRMRTSSCFFNFSFLVFSGLALILIVPISAHCDTIVDSNIITNTTWTKAGSPYSVLIELDIYPDVTLTIRPGVVVIFNARSDLEVYGELIAIGTKTEWISFTSNRLEPPKDEYWKGDWNGISFKENSKGSTTDEGGNYLSGSIIKYCKILYGKGLITIVPLYIANNDISYNAFCGISNFGSNTFILDNIVSFNENRWGEFYENHKGGGIYNSAEHCKIKRNIIQTNRADKGGGIYNEGNSVIIEQNKIDYNTARNKHGCTDWTHFSHGGGIFNIGQTTTIINNEISNNIAVCPNDNLGKGSGIYDYPNITGEPSIIEFNQIKANNFDGIWTKNAILRGNKISQNKIYNNFLTAGVVYGCNAQIEKNVISNNEIIGIMSSTLDTTCECTITNNIVEGNFIGIENYNRSTIIKNNSISRNKLYGIRTTHLESFENNDIFYNELYDFKYVDDYDQLATNNYWGTTNSSEIMENIYDYWDNITLGKVIFEPFSTKPFVIGTQNALPHIPLLLLDP
jgi:hypothetical protein